MATPTQKPFSVLLATSLTLFLLLLNKANSSDVVSFTFTEFQPDQANLIFQGDALVTTTGKLQLTKVKDGKPVWSSVGRALYAAPIHLWDKTTGSVASFVTSFSFVVQAPNANKTADGIAFFLGEKDTKIQEKGGHLGVFDTFAILNWEQAVAVEFDTYKNIWDPDSSHIGIDVNSITSDKTVAWGWENGEVANVFISYQASTQTLTASLTYPKSKKSYILSAAVDVKKNLPEWVRVGFSATTGLTTDYVETHDVLSWSFTSTLKTNGSSGVHAEEDNVQIAHYAA